ncbi:MAG: hypothetical protein ACQEW8_08985 [Actinomycetota bacterium]
MYILLALVAACALGIGVHYTLPHRAVRGVALTPAIATVSAGIIYTVMQWTGVGEDSLWLWIASILGSVLVAIVSTILLSDARRRRDESTRESLGI